MNGSKPTAEQLAALVVAYFDGMAVADMFGLADALRDCGVSENAAEMVERGLLTVRRTSTHGDIYGIRKERSRCRIAAPLLACRMTVNARHNAGRRAVVAGGMVQCTVKDLPQQETQ